MSELEEIRQQLAALTGRVDGIEDLRAMMDRDLADLKQRMDAQDLLLQALHVTQSNHTQRLTRIEESLGRVDEALGRVENDFRGKLDTIVALLDRLVPPQPARCNLPERDARSQPAIAVFALGFQTGSPR